MKNWKFLQVGNTKTGNFSEEDRKIREQMYREQAEKNRKREIERAKQEVRELEDDIRQAEKDLRNEKNPKERMYLETHISRVKKELERAKKTATGNAQTNINGEWKESKSAKEQLIEYAKKVNDPEYLEHVKKMTNPRDIEARLQWHKKFGNETIDPSTQRPDSKIYQTIHEFIKTSGGDADKAFVAIKRKYPNLTDEFIEKSIDEVIRTNKAGNESIDKQEWSLYQGLKKDAEKEIGNESLEDIKKELDKWDRKDEYYTDQLYYLKSLSGSKSEKNLESRIREMQKLRDEARSKRNEYSEKFRKRTGNADPSTEMRNDYNAEIQRLTKKAEQLRRMGQGKSAMEIEKQIEKLGKELSELGNKKVGNAFDAGIHLTIRYNGKEEEVKVLKDMPTSVVVKGQNGAVVEIKKVDLDVLKVHNETKGERKFGKVMGEFEEGALKTPQGKTVTDPAQAKAIAYSEADKVDNLKRARNAMNKKVKNSSVREYKDREGRIAQIDFDSDGTDADMSIYEDDRMTRAVDHKNFSTIRDAEQYVQSHGFRRVG